MTDRQPLLPVACDGARVDHARWRGGEAIVLSCGGHRAVVTLHGGQVVEWQHGAAGPVLWMSPQARPDAGGPMRGGVPVCWPWFAAHPSDPGAPFHGFARTSRWRLVAAEATGAAARAVLGCPAAGEARTGWNGVAELLLEAVLTDRLELSLTTRNLGRGPIALTQALHTYFSVSDVTAATVEGLDGHTYLDKVAGGARAVQTGPIGFPGEVDRIYDSHAGEAMLVDTGAGRGIAIAKSGSSATVVWNPGEARGAAMADVGPEQWRRYVCVETANAGAAVATIAPGASHRIVACYAVTM